MFRPRDASDGRGDRPAGARVEDDEVRRARPRQPRPRAAARPAAEHAGGAGRQRLDRPGERQPVRVDRREQHAERRLDAADPVRGQPELDLLVDLGVRRVVGRDRVGRPVDERREARGGVLGGPQRRVDPAGRRIRRGRRAPRRPTGRARAVAVDRLPRPAPRPGDPLVGQAEVVRRHVAGHRQPGGLRPADRVERAGGREVGQVEPGARARRAGRRPGPRSPARPRQPPPATGQPCSPSTRRDVALVRLGAGGQGRVLGVLDERQPSIPA